MAYTQVIPHSCLHPVKATLSSCVQQKMKAEIHYTDGRHSRNFSRRIGYTSVDSIELFSVLAI